MNIFHKIAILHHINKNKDNVTYGYRYDIGNSAGLHKVEIRNHALKFDEKVFQESKIEIHKSPLGKFLYK